MFRQLANSSTQALEQILAKYGDDLLRRMHHIFPNPEWEEEVLFDTMYALWKMRGQVALMDNPEAWLYKVARNKYIDKVRYERKHGSSYPLEAVSQEWQPGDLPAEKVQVKDMEKLIAQAIQRLPPAQREIFLSSKAGESTRKELAKKFKVSESTIKNHLTMARKTLREYLMKYLHHFLW